MGYGIKGIHLIVHVWVIHFIQSWVKNIVKIYIWQNKILHVLFDWLICVFRQVSSISDVHDENKFKTINHTSKMVALGWKLSVDCGYNK